MGKDYRDDRNRDKNFRGKPVDRSKKNDPYANKKGKGKKGDRPVFHENLGDL